MAWDIEMTFTDPDRKETLPFLITSGQFIAWGIESDATTGEVVGLFIRDSKTRKLIEDRDPIILELFVQILDEVDEISTVCGFSDLWKEHYQNMKRLEQDAWTVLHSKYASRTKKDEAEKALEYAIERQRTQKERAEARRIRVKERGFVYVLKADNGLYKIGKARSIDKRIKQLAVSLPYELKLVEAIETDDCQELEINLHRHFKDKRKRGEWFELDNDDIEYIRELGAIA